MNNITIVTTKTEQIVFGQELFTLNITHQSGNKARLSCSNYSECHIDIFQTNGYKNNDKHRFYKETNDQKKEIQTLRDALEQEQKIKSDGKRDINPVIDSEGNKRWYKDGVLHRTDAPAVEWASGYKRWYQDGVLHRIDGPAVECTNGHKEWYKNDKRHREDGPAIEYADGSKEWWVNGKELWL